MSEKRWGVIGDRGEFVDMHRSVLEANGWREPYFWLQRPDGMWLWIVPEYQENTSHPASTGNLPVVPSRSA